MSAPFIPAPAGRDRRLDVFRGLALLTIFVNHVPGNPLELYTSRNFGFSDAAEGFVLMSGIAVALAYSGGFFKGDVAGSVGRILRRARTLYFVHIACMAAALIIVGVGLHAFGTADIAKSVNFTRLQTDTVTALIGFPLLGYQIGYFNILPLYVVLLIASTGFLWIGVRSIGAMLALSVAIWLAAHLTGWNFPNWPGVGGWFFNPFGWQLIFVVGVAGGLASRQGRTLVAFNPVLYWVCCAFLAWSGYWVFMRMGAVPGIDLLPDTLADTDKGALAFLRLLHILALAYVIVHTKWIAWLVSTPLLRPVERMGKNGLAVFATGSLIAILLQVVFSAWPTNESVKIAVMAVGVAVQYAVALHFDRRKAEQRRMRETAPRHRGKTSAAKASGVVSS